MKIKFLYSKATQNRPIVFIKVERTKVFRSTRQIDGDAIFKIQFNIDGKKQSQCTVFEPKKKKYSNYIPNEMRNSGPMIAGPILSYYFDHYPDTKYFCGLTLIFYIGEIETFVQLILFST